MSQKEFEGLVFATQIPVKGKFNDSQTGSMTYNWTRRQLLLSRLPVNQVPPF